MGRRKRLTMKNVYIIVFFIATSLFVSCNKTIQDTSKTEGIAINQTQVVQVIDVAVFEKEISQEDVQLIDVRTQEEWEEGHLKNAQRFQINNPKWDEQIATLDKTKPVYVYCAKGGRSARSAKQLKDAGFLEIYDLEGGMTSWKEAGKAIE